jgi:hypothetical protein
MIAGGLGGTTGDLLMHSLDTVKTRQQGDPHLPPKYTNLLSSYTTILRQEGIRRGLYGGWVPAMLGSFPGTVIFFGTYEYSKRHMIDFGVRPQIAYLTSGILSRHGSIGLEANRVQVSLQISQPLSYTSPRKSLKPAYSFKADITILPFGLDTTTNPQHMQHEP